MAGMVFNGLRPLDLAADSSHQTKIQGDVHLLESIPFNYRERHPRLFEYGKYTNNNNIQRTGPSAGLAEPGVNDDLIGMFMQKCLKNIGLVLPKYWLLTKKGSVTDQLIPRSSFSPK